MALTITGAAASADRLLSGPVVRSIVLPTGVTLEYTEQGDPRGVAVILLHGYTDSRRSWDLVLPHLPSRFLVYAISQRGHGLSSVPATGYAARDFAGDLRAFLDAKQVQRAVIVGHSMGSMVAQQFAVDNPDRVSKLILTGAFFMRPGHPVLVEFGKEVAALPDQVDPQFVLGFQQSTVTKPLDPEFFATIVSESRRLPGRVWRDAFKEFLRTDLTVQLEGITVPTLIIWGDRDTFSVRADQESLLARIKGARLSTYVGTGHAANWEEPARFAAEVVEFINESD